MPFPHTPYPDASLSEPVSPQEFPLWAEPLEDRLLENSAEVNKEEDLKDIVTSRNESKTPRHPHNRCQISDKENQN